MTALALAVVVAAGCRSAEEAPAAAAPGGEATPAAAAAAAPAIRQLDPPAGAGAMAFQLTTGSEGGILLSWLEPSGAADVYRLRASRLEGDRWGEPTTVVEGASFFANWADVPAVAEGPEGLVATWLEKLGTGTYAYGVALAASEDGGATWQRLGWLHADTSQSEHGFVSLLPQADGVHAVWLDGGRTVDGKPMGLRTATFRDGRVQGERALDESVCDCCNTAVAAAGDRMVVAYRDRTADEHRDVAVALAGATGAPAAGDFPRDGWVIAACPVNGPALAAQGNAVAAAWYSASDDRPRVQAAFSTDGGATFGPPLVVDGEKPWGRVGIARADDGSAVVSWLAAGEGEQAAVRLRRAQGTNLGTPLTVATTGASRKSGVPRLARRGDDLLVAWRDDAKGTLHVSVVPLAAVPAVAPPAGG